MLYSIGCDWMCLHSGVFVIPTCARAHRGVSWLADRAWAVDLCDLAFTALLIYVSFPVEWGEGYSLNLGGSHEKASVKYSQLSSLVYTTAFRMTMAENSPRDTSNRCWPRVSSSCFRSDTFVKASF